MWGPLFSLWSPFSPWGRVPFFFMEAFFTIWGPFFFFLDARPWGSFFSLFFYFSLYKGPLDGVLAFYHEGSLFPIMRGGGFVWTCPLAKNSAAPMGCMIIFITNNNTIIYKTSKVTCSTVIVIFTIIINEYWSILKRRTFGNHRSIHPY